MNKKELIATVATKTKLPKTDVEGVINTTMDTIKTSVKKKDDVTLVGFGTFTTAKRAARAGVNPATGEKIQIKAKNVIKFRPGSQWTNTLNPRRK